MNLIFVGAGGFFLELYEYIANDINTGILKDLTIKGAIDDKTPDKLLAIPYLGTVGAYQPLESDIFVIAIGNVGYRETVYNKLKDKSVSFLTYIHPTALVSPSARLGEGVIVCPFSIINAAAVVNENVAINVNVSIGHEAFVGSHSVLSPYGALNGVARIGKKVFLGTRSTVFPGVSVGDECVIDSHSAVRKNADKQFFLSDRANFLAVKNRFLR
ncbi:sugar O-acyltransferase (sialic acid O-acetyltransferase NeuD family) [Aeromonas veronii]|uniref:acetyltransferase n=1 Tax=Aeromonas veronii TaxID=654 RepID=UPI001613D2D6|nr:acetyltransferase [Aeromonas veronii]MCS3831917.1 sugar O-acyltransferase (sialic acid O-acetyltransferase NeuD family) [Aeromonas veronii]